jgi:hypothetical protein
MKKFFFVAAACCLMTLCAVMVSCDPNKAQCWKMYVGYPSGQTEVFYFYGTGVEADAQLELYVKAGANSTRREQTFLSESNCHE